jgi:hypothetical protein
MRPVFTKEDFVQYKEMIQRIKKETDTSKTPKLFAELDRWLKHKGFTDEIIDKMDKRIEAEEKGIRVIK